MQSEGQNEPFLGLALIAQDALWGARASCPFWLASCQPASCQPAFGGYCPPFDPFPWLRLTGWKPVRAGKMPALPKSTSFDGY
jgi:hypothetical protein